MFDVVWVNLFSPPILFFLLGMGAALIGSDLSIPKVIGKTLALYLMLAIGFKGGVALHQAVFSSELIWALLLGTIISFLLPFPAYFWFRKFSQCQRIDAAAIAAHYGSVSVVTFIAATELLRHFSDAPPNSTTVLFYPGYMVAVMAIMESPAILSGLVLAGRIRKGNTHDRFAIWRDALTNGSVVMLLGAFIIGWITGPVGLNKISAFIVAPFQGVLCLFLLDMGLLAVRQMKQDGGLRLSQILGGLILPPCFGSLAICISSAFGFPFAAVFLFGVLAGSASYIAVPAAMRLALPAARGGWGLSLSLGVTFPFNLTLGLPLYYWLSQLLTQMTF